VYYDVGFRSEPQGRTGFAHLFEHMMFQGSANLGKMAHAHHVQGAGGTMNGSTHPDFTNYFEALPSNALELALFLEADRMRSLALTQENLDNQVAVVQNEIRVNVLNRPYGGFPWILLPPVAFDSFPNAHNGYGDFSELEAATLADARDFFERFYPPSNAVLCVVGDVDVTRALALAERHFGDIPGRPAPQRAPFAEAPLAAERRALHHDRQAPSPALALGWRAPDPDATPREHLAAVALAEVLAEGDASRLRRSLVLDLRIAIDVEAYLGTFGDPFEQRDPQLFTITAVHPGEVGVDTVIDAVDRELDRVATDGLEPGELARVQALLCAQLLRRLDHVLGRTQQFAMFELLRGRAEAVYELPERVAEVGEADIRAAAARLRASHRAVLELVPGDPAAALTDPPAGGAA
jgi:predicted Zn-dependent peptidase